MIIKKHIEKDLIRLNDLYLDSLKNPDPSVPKFFAKLAILELSGWIEESFDKIAYRSVRKKIISKKFQGFLEDTVQRNHGFHFDNNFLNMLGKILGLRKCEMLHDILETSGRLAILTTEIEALLKQRKTAAHVYLHATNSSYDAPSFTLGRLRKIFPILKEIYKWSCSC